MYHHSSCENSPNNADAPDKFSTFVEMRSLLICFAVLAFCMNAFSQNGYIAVKKGNKTIRMIFKDNPFTFKMANGEWITGTVDKIEDSSFTFTQEIIRYYPIGTDTFRIYGYRFTANEIDAVPSSRQSFVYRNDKVVIVPGRERFMWLRNGFLFQAAGASYLAENIINDLANHEPPFKSSHIGGLAIAAGVLVIGTIMHFTFDPTIHFGRKYSLQFVSY